MTSIYIPLEILSHILSFVPLVDQALSASAVCRVWHSLLDDADHWKHMVCSSSSNGAIICMENLETLFRILRAQYTIHGIKDCAIVKAIYFDLSRSRFSTSDGCTGRFNTTNRTRYGSVRISDLPHSDEHGGPIPLIKADDGRPFVLRYELPTDRRIRRWHMDRNVQTWDPVPLAHYRHVPLFYYEVTVLSIGQHSRQQEQQESDTSPVAIGFAVEKFCMGSQPGWWNGSCGFHGDDGGLYVQQGFTRRYFESYGVGDTVGMGILADKGTVFATKNGRFLGVVCTADFAHMHVAIGLWEECEVQVNMGEVGPFAFNLESLFTDSTLQERIHAERDNLKQDSVPHVGRHMRAAASGNNNSGDSDDDGSIDLISNDDDSNDDDDDFDDDDDDEYIEYDDNYMYDDDDDDDDDDESDGDHDFVRDSISDGM